MLLMRACTTAAEDPKAVSTNEHSEAVVYNLTGCNILTSKAYESEKSPITIPGAKAVAPLKR